MDDDVVFNIWKKIVCVRKAKPFANKVTGVIDVENFLSLLGVVAIFQRDLYWDVYQS